MAKSSLRSARMRAKLANLVQRIRNELLPAVARIHAHHQNVIDNIQHVFEQPHRRGRIDHDAGLSALFPDHVQRPVQIPADLIMHADAIGARLDKDRSIGIWIFNHQMMIQFDVREAPEGFSNRRPMVKFGTKCPSMMSTWIISDARCLFDTPDLLA